MAVRLGGRVDAYEDDIGLANGGGNVCKEVSKYQLWNTVRYPYSIGGRELSDCEKTCGEVQVLAAAAHDDLGEPRLVDGETVRVPLPDPLLALVHHGDLDAGALVRDDGAGRAADVPGADAANLRNLRRRHLVFLQI